jgi:uncharacterized membrane protein YgdD (TMEM256/DUF423 family)
MARVFILLAVFFAFTGVGLGAFAAHGLKGRLSAEYLVVFQTGVQYQLWHALALLAMGLLALQLQVPGRALMAAGSLFVLGTLLFSGSLYLLTLSGFGKLGMITPLGGLAFLAGWLCLGWGAWQMATPANGG